MGQKRIGKNVRRLYLAALILVLVVAASVTRPAWSAPPDPSSSLNLEAEAAFDGYFKYGEWLPIWVQLENKGADLEAEVRVRVPGNWGATTFAVPVSLPSGARKRIPVYALPNSFSHALEVTLVADDGVLLLRRVPVQPLPNINFLVGLVAPQRGGLALISAVSLPGQERPITLVDLSLAEIPEQPESLRSLDVLILNDTDTSSLTPDQKAAIETWVRQGGRLVIGGGPGAAHTVAGLPRSLLPSAASEMAELESLPALADFAGAEAVRVPGPFTVAIADPGEGYTLAAQEGLPLIREQVVGRGLVDFVALDLAVAPFDAWVGTAAFWERLLSPGAAYPDWLPRDVSARQLKSSQMTYALSQLPGLDLPSIRGLGLLLIAYVALVGPANYLVLRWQRRLHWAWASIPLATLVFSAGAFGLGYAMRGTDLILNKVAVLELGADGMANVSSYLGLFSPARQSYEIEVKGAKLLSPLAPDSDQWGPGAGGEMVFVQNDPALVRGLAVNQWSMQTFMTEGVWAEVGTIHSDLQLQDGKLAGTVRNETGQTLKDAALVLGNRVVHLGDVQPGQVVTVAADLSGLDNQDVFQPLSFLLLEDQLAQTGLGAPPREVELKRMVLDNVFGQGVKFGLTSSSFGPAGVTNLPGGLALIAWLGEAPPQVYVAGRVPTQQTTALLYAPLAYHLPQDGDLHLPPGLVPGGLVKLPEEGGLCGPHQAAVWLGRGEAIFEFQLPEEAQDVQEGALKLAIVTDAGGWWQPPDTAVYDWDRKTWAALDDPVLGLNVIPNAAEKISDAGIVRVRLSSESNRGGCLYLELGLEGMQ